jgi:hypothetical protein
LKEKPTPPREPTAEECCGKGCTPCVFDQYAEALERYRAELEAWNIKSSKPKQRLKNNARRRRVRV